MNTLSQWCQRWSIPSQAEQELRVLLGQIPLSDEEVIHRWGVLAAHSGSTDSETMVQSKARLRAAQLGYGLWRNNVGVLPNPTGRPVRYGLANDSAKLNAAIKSGDLIGLRPVLITPDMVGHVIGQFVSYEAKPADWKYAGTEREIAQAKWIEIVTALGGHAKFITGEDQL